MSCLADLLPGRFLPGSTRVLVVALAACSTAAVRGADVNVDGLAAEGLGVKKAVEEAAPQAGAGAAFRVLRGLFGPNGSEPNADPDLPEGANGPMPDDPQQAAAWQHRQQVRQQAAQVEQVLQPVLNAELELVRNACGDDALPAEARRRLLAAGRAATRQAALLSARVAINGGDRELDVRRTIHEAISGAVKANVPAEAFAAYERQVVLRSVRRDRAARNRIVSLIDRQIDLTPEQHRRIEADLEAAWNADWPWAIDIHGVQINGFRPAPDYASGCVVPHLDDRQRADWRKWCAAAGVREHGLEGWGREWNFDNGQGLGPDAWWGK